MSSCLAPAAPAEQQTAAMEGQYQQAPCSSSSSLQGGGAAPCTVPGVPCVPLAARTGRHMQRYHEGKRLCAGCVAVRPAPGGSEGDMQILLVSSRGGKGYGLPKVRCPHARMQQQQLLVVSPAARPGPPNSPPPQTTCLSLLLPAAACCRVAGRRMSPWRMQHGGRRWRRPGCGAFWRCAVCMRAAPHAHMRACRLLRCAIQPSSQPAICRCSAAWGCTRTPAHACHAGACAGAV